MKIGKVWGTTEPLLQTPIIEIHRLYIEPNRCCSLHWHAHKWNAFVVLSGRLTIEAHKSDYDLIDRTVLVTNDMTTIPPGEVHRFVTTDSDCWCLEIYYPELLSEDIVRESVGGIYEDGND